MDATSCGVSCDPQGAKTPNVGSSETINPQSKQTNPTQQLSSTSLENSISGNNSEVQKRKLQIESSISISQNGDQTSKEHFTNRKRKCFAECQDKFKAKEEKPSEDSMSEEEREVFSLLVSKIPYQWTCEQITDYVQEHCVEVYALEQLEGGDPESGQAIRLLFLNFEKCNQARKQLKLKSIEGRKLSVAFSVPEDSESDVETEKTVLLGERNSESRYSLSLPWRPDLDIWAPDPTAMYGLKSEYMESLGITPPIDKWVHVSNFRCDKLELKEVLELAGQVVTCTVISVNNKYAKVMYSHPLEAVQAVSMLNGQIFYGQVLKVSMYKCPNNEMILPKGLSNVGPGLGKQGKPLRDIVKQYERHLNGKSSSINESVFIETRDTASDLRYTSNNATGSRESLTSDKNLNSNSIDKQIDSNLQQRNIQGESNVSQQFGPTEVGLTNQTLVRSTINSAQQSHPQSFPQPIVSAGPNTAPTHSADYNWVSPTISVSQPFSNNPITNHSGTNIYQSGLAGPSSGPHQFNGPLSGSNPSQRGPTPRFGGLSGANITINNAVPRMSGSVPRAPVPRPYFPRFNNPNTAPSVCQSGSNTWRNNSGHNLNNLVTSAPIPVVGANRTMCGPQQPVKGTSSVVELSNLPLTTTFPLLTEKLAQVGQVMSLELTRAGCALVRFASPSQADRCYQHFNNMCVMGNFIEVKFI